MSNSVYRKKWTQYGTFCHNTAGVVTFPGRVSSDIEIIMHSRVMTINRVKLYKDLEVTDAFVIDVS